jgi:hypothetical protein
MDAFLSRRGPSLEIKLNTTNYKNYSIRLENDALIDGAYLLISLLQSFHPELTESADFDEMKRQADNVEMLSSCWQILQVRSGGGVARSL